MSGGRGSGRERLIHITVLDDLSVSSEMRFVLGKCLVLVGVLVD